MNKNDKIPFSEAGKTWIPHHFENGYEVGYAHGSKDASEELTALRARLEKAENVVTAARMSFNASSKAECNEAAKAMNRALAAYDEGVDK